MERQYSFLDEQDAVKVYLPLPGVKQRVQPQHVCSTFGAPGWDANLPSLRTSSTPRLVTQPSRAVPHLVSARHTALGGAQHSVVLRLPAKDPL